MWALKIRFGTISSWQGVVGGLYFACCCAIPTISTTPRRKSSQTKRSCSNAQDRTQKSKSMGRQAELNGLSLLDQDGRGLSRRRETLRERRGGGGMSLADGRGHAMPDMHFAISSTPDPVQPGPRSRNEVERGRCRAKGARLMAWCESQNIPQTFSGAGRGVEVGLAWFGCPVLGSDTNVNVQLLGSSILMPCCCICMRSASINVG
jgi:hypothetical protein